MIVSQHAVKALPLSSSLLPELVNEVQVYQTLQPLQDAGVIPRVVATGHMFGGGYLGIVMELLGPNLDSMPLSQLQQHKRGAVQALQIFHAHHYLHGDIRLANFVIAAEGKRIVILDLAFAEPSKSANAQALEMEQLLSLFESA